MHSVLVLASTASTRKTFHDALSTKNIEVHRAKDAAEALLALTAFEIDTVILVDEAELYDLEIMIAILRKRFNHKRLILISPILNPDGFEHYNSSSGFLEYL